MPDSAQICLSSILGNANNYSLYLECRLPPQIHKSTIWAIYIGNDALISIVASLSCSSIKSVALAHDEVSVTSDVNVFNNVSNPCFQPGCIAPEAPAGLEAQPVDESCFPMLDKQIPWIVFSTGGL